MSKKEAAQQYGLRTTLSNSSPAIIDEFVEPVVTLSPVFSRHGHLCLEVNILISFRRLGLYR